MSHKSHPINPSRWQLNCIVLASSFLLALFLHLDLGAGNAGLTNESSLIVDNSGKQWADIEALSIVGLKRQIHFDNNGAEASQVQRFWQEFLDDPIHSNVDWTDSQTVYAYFVDIDRKQKTAVLILGYEATKLSAKEAYETFNVRSGKYRHHNLTTIDDREVVEVWTQILNQQPEVHAVLERYGLDGWGNTKSIQIQTVNRDDK